MPRPKKFTERIRRERRETQAEIDDKAFRRASVRTEAEIDRDVGLAADLVSVLGLSVLLGLPDSHRQDLALELSAQFPEIRWEWQTGSEIEPDRSLPILGGVQPTQGEMRATIDAGLKHALRLRDWYRCLPHGLLLKQTVPMTTPPQQNEQAPALGVVIEQLAGTLEALATRYNPKRGRQPGRRAVAQRAARKLIWFIDRHAPNAPIAKRQEFVFRCMQKLGIDCPNPEDDQNDFNEWFGEVEALARSRPRSIIGSSDGSYEAALHRLRGEPL